MIPIAKGKFAKPRPKGEDEQMLEQELFRLSKLEQMVNDQIVIPEENIPQQPAQEPELPAQEVLEEVIPEEAVPVAVAPDAAVPEETTFEETVTTQVSMDEVFPEEDTEVKTKKSVAKKKVVRSSEERARIRKIFAISLCSVIAVALIASVVCVWYFVAWPTSGGKILDNVIVAGINLGGMTRDEAEAVLRQNTDGTYTKQNMQIVLPDTIMELTPADTGASLDVKKAVAAAVNYGRVGSYQEREAAKAAAATTVHTIAFDEYMTLDTAYIRQQLEAYGAAFNSEYSPSSAVMEGAMPVLDAGAEGFDPAAPCQTLVVTLGTPGRYVNIEDVYERVLDAYCNNRFQVTVTMESPETIPETIDIAGLHTQYSSEAVEPSVDPETYVVTYETYGYTFDLDAALAQMEKASYGDVLEIPMTYIVTEKAGADMAAMLFRDVLAEFQTEHTNNKNRNNNLTLACAAVNGFVMGPGETFDFNTVVGKRTSEKGYKAADAYDGGMTVKTLGGGICQVSSTIYYCCLISDLEILERSPHSYVSSYMPMGTDATVSWGGPEFSFKNNTNYPIRIEAEVSDGYVKVKLIGTDEKDYYIEMESEIKGISYAKTVYQEIPEDNNPNGYKDGETISSPYNGYSIQTYKLKYNKETGELISKEEDRLSRYKKRDYTIAKIVKATEPPATEAPKPESPAPEGGSSGGSTDSGAGASTGDTP